MPAPDDDTLPRPPAQLPSRVEAAHATRRLGNANHPTQHCLPIQRRPEKNFLKLSG